MSIQRDPDGRRSVRVECEVPGIPEQVWQAIATGPGISAWFVPTVVDGREGGEIQCDFGGGMVSKATITAWQAPHRFAAESAGWAPGMPPLASEWSVEAKGGGKCIVRVVNSLFASTDDWDNQLEGTENGWPSFFRVLQRYLRLFAGQPSALVQVTAMSPEPVDKAWPTLMAAIGGEPRTGQRLSLPIAPGITLAGKVERVDDLGNGCNVELLLEQPAPGTLLAGAYACGGTMVQMASYLYGAGAERAAAQLREPLAKWLSGHFPAQMEQGG